MKTKAGRQAGSKTFPCPTCGKTSSVIDSRPSSIGTRRRRRCKCGARWTTIEVIAQHGGGMGWAMVPTGQTREMERRYDLALVEMRNLVELMQGLKPVAEPALPDDSILCSD